MKSEIVYRLIKMAAEGKGLFDGPVVYGPNCKAYVSPPPPQRPYNPYSLDPRDDYTVKQYASDVLDPIGAGALAGGTMGIPWGPGGVYTGAKLGLIGGGLYSAATALPKGIHYLGSGLQTGAQGIYDEALQSYRLNKQLAPHRKRLQQYLQPHK